MSSAMHEGSVEQHAGADLCRGSGCNRARVPAVAHAAERSHPDVRLSPEDAFRHPRRTAGVQDVEVVRVVLENWRCWSSRRESPLVVPRAWQQGFSRGVRHLKKQWRSAKAGENISQGGREPSVVDDGRGVCVVQQVGEFGGDIAIIDVERGGARRVPAQRGLQIFRTVEQVEADRVLTDFPGLEFRPVPVCAEPA